MRRILSILLIAIFGFAPLTVLAEGNGESRLPICCRRNGAHHCGMPEDAVSRIVTALAGSRHTIGAPSHCPLFPAAQNATLFPHFAPAESVAIPAVSTTGRVHTSPSSRGSQPNTSPQPVRGPPAAVLA